MAGKKDLERLRRRRRRKQRIIRATVHLFVWLGMAVLYYVGFSVFFDTPVRIPDEALDRPPAPRIRRRSSSPVRLALDRSGKPLGTRPQRFPHPLRVGAVRFRLGARTAGRVRTYEKIVGRSTRQLKRELRETGEPRWRRQLDDAQRLVPRTAGAHRHGGPQVRQHPLDPARDQQAADVAHSLLRHAHPPLLQDAAIASGRGLHHPRGFARLRHGRRRGARRGAAQLDVRARPS